MVDKVLRGAAANQEGIQHHDGSAKATARCATRGGKYPIKKFVGCMVQKEKSLTAEKNFRLSRKEQMMMDRLRSGHCLDLKYLLHRKGGQWTPSVENVKLEKRQPNMSCMTAPESTTCCMNQYHMIYY